MDNEKPKKKKTAAKKKAAEGKETRAHKAPWQETTATVDDIMRFLDDRVMLRYNTVTRRVECHIVRNYKLRSPAEYEPLTDRMVNSLWAEMAQTQEKTVRVQDMQRVIESDYVADYDPFRFYIERLPPWNPEKDDYIMELSLSVMVKGDSDEQILFYQCLKKWLVGMVAGWIDPRVVNNVILVLIGEQGSYKTTWFTHLLPPELRPYFRIKTNSSRMTKDDLLALTQYGLVCYEELDTMTGRELNELKSAVTMPAVDERPAYGRYHEHRRHLASFCGTGNNVQFLCDPTGNRRWLPFEVESITPPREQPFNYEGIYAQAYRLYRDGFQFWFSQAEIQRLARHNEQFEAVHSELELVDLHFRKPVGKEPRELVSATMALQMIGGNIVHSLSKEKIGHAFAKLGFEYRRKPSMRGYIAIHRTGVEMEAYRRKLAEKETGMTDDSMTANS